jgi:hypothetical protein
MPELPDASTQFMLAEHAQSYEMYRHSEELGERRVNFLLTLVGGVGAALVLRDEPLVENGDVDASALYLLIVLLAFGAVTLLRIARRDTRSDRQLLALAKIRGYFTDNDPNIEPNLIFAVGRGPGGRQRPWKHVLLPGTGGLADTVRLINGVVGAGFAGLLAVDWGASDGTAAVIGGVTFLALWVAQFAALNLIHGRWAARERAADKKRGASEPSG